MSTTIVHYDRTEQPPPRPPRLRQLPYIDDSDAQSDAASVVNVKPRHGPPKHQRQQRARSYKFRGSEADDERAEESGEEGDEEAEEHMVLRGGRPLLVSNALQHNKKQSNPLQRLPLITLDQFDDLREMTTDDPEEPLYLPRPRSAAAAAVETSPAARDGSPPLIAVVMRKTSIERSPPVKHKPVVQMRGGLQLLREQPSNDSASSLPATVQKVSQVSEVAPPPVTPKLVPDRGPPTPENLRRLALSAPPPIRDDTVDSDVPSLVKHYDERMKLHTPTQPSLATAECSLDAGTGDWQPRAIIQRALDQSRTRFPCYAVKHGLPAAPPDSHTPVISLAEVVFTVVAVLLLLLEVLTDLAVAVVHIVDAHVVVGVLMLLFVALTVIYINYKQYNNISSYPDIFGVRSVPGTRVLRGLACLQLMPVYVGYRCLKYSLLYKLSGQRVHYNLARVYNILLLEANHCESTLLAPASLLLQMLVFVHAYVLTDEWTTGPKTTLLFCCLCLSLMSLSSSIIVWERLDRIQVFAWYFDSEGLENAPDDPLGWLNWLPLFAANCCIFSSRVLAVSLFCCVAGWLSLLVLVPHFVACLTFLVVPYELLPDVRDLVLELRDAAINVLHPHMWELLYDEYFRRFLHTMFGGALRVVRPTFDFGYATEGWRHDCTLAAVEYFYCINFFSYLYALVELVAMCLYVNVNEQHAWDQWMAMAVAVSLYVLGCLLMVLHFNLNQPHLTASRWWETWTTANKMAEMFADAIEPWEVEHFISLFLPYEIFTDNDLEKLKAF